jgi:hypothetical protein
MSKPFTTAAQGRTAARKDLKGDRTGRGHNPLAAFTKAGLTEWMKQSCGSTEEYRTAYVETIAASGILRK